MRVRHLGCVDYETVWQEMRNFTAQRTAETPDEIWLLQHPPVYTQGQAGKAEHILNPGKIPIVLSDRGGQVTYHGPGQIVAYILMDLRRAKLTIRQLVTSLESAIIHVLADYGIEAQARPTAPGVYIGKAKIAALGLRVRQGRSYHGLAFNIDMDLEPFSRINPCGYKDLPVTQLIDLLDNVLITEVEAKLLENLKNSLKNSV